MSVQNPDDVLLEKELSLPLPEANDSFSYFAIENVVTEMDPSLGRLLEENSWMNCLWEAIDEELAQDSTTFMVCE